MLGTTPNPSFDAIHKDASRVFQQVWQRDPPEASPPFFQESIEIMLVILSLLSVARVFAYETLSIKHAYLPQDNAPLNYMLAWDISQLYGYNGPNNKLTYSFVPTSCGANLSIYHTDPGESPDGDTPEHPILLLNHGYPESSYI